MTEILAIMYPIWEQTPAQLKNFPIIIPDGVVVNKIYACIRTPGAVREGVLNDFAGSFSGFITLDLSMAFPNYEFVILGFHYRGEDKKLVAEYTGRATDLERLDQIQLRLV